MIKKFENFSEEFDEARFNISDGDSYLFFYFGESFITNPVDTYDLIDYYKKTYKENGEWGGGPVNKRFRSYMVKNYPGYFSHDQLTKVYKPSLALFIFSYFGTMIMSFNLWDYKPISIFPVLQSNKYLNDLQKEIETNSDLIIGSESQIIQGNSWGGENMPYVSQMNKLWRSFYDGGGKTIFEVKDYFGLEPRGWDLIFGSK